MTRIVLVCAAPTLWDDENRLVGNYSLPLTAQAVANLKSLVDAIPGSISCIYVDKTSEPAMAVGKLLASRFKLRTRHGADLGEINLGLWQGLDRPALRTRFESSFPLWEQNPLAVTPPQGESVERAIERLRKGLTKILKRNRCPAIAIPTRPLAMQMLLGILRCESLEQIAGHLHQPATMETIELADEQIAR